VNKKAFNSAYDAASLALKGVVVLSTLGATHYHASYVQPSWSMTMVRLQQIQTHIFYTDADQPFTPGTILHENIYK
jgi:spore germination cell wall hydrolase CwlJ-like protein